MIQEYGVFPGQRMQLYLGIYRLHPPFHVGIMRDFNMVIPGCSVSSTLYLKVLAIIAYTWDIQFVFHVNPMCRRSYIILHANGVP